MHSAYDLAVVGAGLIGAAAGRHAAAAGARVVVIGPEEPDDPAGFDGPLASHHDSGRITRHLDASPVWAELAARAIAEYPALEAASGIRFHHPVGLLWADPVGLDNLTPAARRYGYALEPLGAGQARAEAHWSFPDDHALGIERGPAGFIDPRRMRRAQLVVAAQAGAEIIEDVVTEVLPSSRGAMIRLRSGRTLGTSRTIVASGIYSAFMLSPLAVVPIAPIAVAVIKAEVSEETVASLSAMPAMIYRAGGDESIDIYAVPPVRYPDGRWYVKLGAETVPETELVDGVAVRRWMAGTAESWRGHLEARLYELMPDVPVAATYVRPCAYARTPHRYPFIDHIADGVVIAAGGNGRAAKSADAIGAIAVRLALSGVWDDELDPGHFQLPR